jgi:chromosome partitioning protein
MKRSPKRNGNSPTIHENLSLLAGSIRCAGVEKILLGELDAYTRMRTLFTEAAFHPFDYILIDCPPSLGVLTVNALAVAHYLVIPMNPSLYSMQGTNDLMQTVAKVKKDLKSVDQPCRGDHKRV